jgi:uncharacterized RDD family membrane protein YckC
VSNAPLPPPGWFPDPDVPTRLRYWDGNVWTSHTNEIVVTPTKIGSIVTQSGARLELASWWRRVAGLLLDALIIGVPVFAVSVVLGWIFYSSSSALIELNHPPTAGHAARFALLLAVAAVNIAYAVWFLGHRSRTIGMSIVGVKTLDQSGDPLSHSQAWRRAFTVFLLVNIWLLPGVFCQSEPTKSPRASWPRQPLRAPLHRRISYDIPVAFGQSAQPNASG